jgi:protein YIPF1/2
VCVIPLEAVKWSCTMAALGLSGWFIAANLWPLGAQANRSVAFGVAVAALLGQAGLALCFKFVFYTYYATGS